MKKLIVLIVLVFASAIPLHAQVMCVTQRAMVAKTSTTTTDSVKNISLFYGNGDSYIRGQMPDSVRMVAFGYGGTTGDSVGVLLKYQTLFSPSETKYSLTTLDSLTSQGTVAHALPASAFTPKALLNVYTVPITTGHTNASASAYPATIWLYVQYFYHVAR